MDKKLGGDLLSCAIQEAWKFNINRVWLQTCLLDHENARKNYIARGFTFYKEEFSEEDCYSEETVATQIGEFFLDYTKRFAVYPDLNSIIKKLQSREV
ncbi:hypothetical protein [Flavobacterium facile]|uniref:hypothetical protein n=1 Tax=Flavobacterium facile TaxID=2893174 RepID=UPI002E78D3BE|nr:hypothetical protein [Flavobacterium sp. T-12]